MDLGVEQGLVRKAGAWFTYEGEQLGQGRENARYFLRDNPDLADELEKRIKEKMGVGAAVDLRPTGRAGVGRLLIDRSAADGSVPQPSAAEDAAPRGHVSTPRRPPGAGPSPPSRGLRQLFGLGGQPASAIRCPLHRRRCRSTGRRGRRA